jgi:hypothetical protein
MLLHKHWTDQMKSVRVKKSKAQQQAELLWHHSCSKESWSKRIAIVTQPHTSTPANHTTPPSPPLHLKPHTHHKRNTCKASLSSLSMRIGAGRPAHGDGSHLPEPSPCPIHRAGPMQAAPSARSARFCLASPLPHAKPIMWRPVTPTSAMSSGRQPSPIFAL